MKHLKIFKDDNGDFVLIRVNEFGTGFKSQFITTEGLLEHLEVYKRTGNINEYQLDVSEELWATVINFLAKA